MPKRIIPNLVAVLLAVCSTAAIAADAVGDVERGATLADTCLGCHGIVGYRNAYPSYRVPKLGGQHPEYLVIALKGYSNGTRGHKTMHAQAVTHTEQEMQDIAAFFASHGGPEEGKARNSAQIARGKEKSATCAACHGANGISTNASWPTLAGQHRDYLEQALHEYKAGNRKDPVMAGQVTNLSEQDIEDLAAYFSAQPGLFTVRYDE